MRYGTLIDGQPVPAPNPIHVDGRAIYNPHDNTYAAMGYLPIVDTPMPEQVEDAEPVYYAPQWEEQNDQIVRMWEATDPPKPEPVPPTTEERLSALESAMLAVMGGGLDV